MVKKIELLTMLLIVLLSQNSPADDGQDYAAGDNMFKERSTGLILSQWFSDYQNIKEIDAARRNYLEMANGDGIKNIEFNQDGTINNVAYDDGTVIVYNYHFGDSNKMDRLEMSDGKTMLSFQNSGIGAFGQKSESADNEFVVEVYIKDPAGKNGKDNTAGTRQPPVASIRHPNNAIDLNTIATTPVKIDFKEIKRAIDNASKMKGKALHEYDAAISSYYEKMEKEMRAAYDKLKSDGIDVNMLPSKIGSDNTNVVERRKMVDDFIGLIHSEVKKGARGESIMNFADFEAGMRDAFLEPGKKIFRDRLKEATGYLYNMIDKLLNSRLALYMKVKKDTIDVIINLPERVKKENTPKE